MNPGPDSLDTLERGLFVVTSPYGQAVDRGYALVCPYDPDRFMRTICVASDVRSFETFEIHFTDPAAFGLVEFRAVRPGGQWGVRYNDGNRTRGIVFGRAPEALDVPIEWQSIVIGASGVCSVRYSEGEVAPYQRRYISGLDLIAPLLADEPQVRREAARRFSAKGGLAMLHLIENGIPLFGATGGEGPTHQILDRYEPEDMVPYLQSPDKRVRQEARLLLGRIEIQGNDKKRGIAR